MTKRLSVVRPDDPPPTPKRRRPKRVPSIVEAAASGDMKDQLIALRARVARAVEDPNCPPRDLAALSRRLIEIAREIAAIEADEREEAGGATATPDEKWSSG